MNNTSTLPYRRSRTWLQDLTVRLAVTPPGIWLVRQVVSRLDVWLSRCSNGRLSITKMLGFPMLILTTRGIKSGELRYTPLIYEMRDEEIIVIASSLGSERHPQWYRNLLRQPGASLSIDGQEGKYTYRLLEGEERRECWQLMLELYPGYDDYAQLAGNRHIPVILFSPLD